ncbi:MAG: hypothetical protein US50_C0036G0001, partial [Candidatus Nomurabacteria bacterium GW2011_GWB1_37_5]
EIHIFLESLRVYYGKDSAKKLFKLQCGHNNEIIFINAHGRNKTD